MKKDKEGYYVIVRLHKDDIANIIGQKKTKKIKESKIQKIVENMTEILSGEYYSYALEETLDKFNIK